MKMKRNCENIKFHETTTDKDEVNGQNCENIKFHETTTDKDEVNEDEEKL